MDAHAIDTQATRATTGVQPDFERLSLESDLRRAVRGEVRFDAGSRALYATDGSNYRQPPIGVVLPRDVDDVVAAVEVCRRHHAPIFGRGGGTGLAGQCCNAAVCLDMSKYMNRVLEVDPVRRLARAQPGTILDDLRHAAEQHGLTFGPDPSTHDHCTIGGMVGNDSCGVHSVMSQFAGLGAKTADNVQELEILTYEGIRLRVGPTSPEELDAIVRQPDARGRLYGQLRALRDRCQDAIRRGFPKIPRCVSGFNLPWLLPENGFNVARAVVGSESTCVLVLEVAVNLIPNPATRTLLVVGYPSVYEAGDHIPEVLEHRPIGLEGIDEGLVRDMTAVGIHPKDVRLLPEGRGWLLVEFGGKNKQEADGHARHLMSVLQQRGHPASAMKLFDDPKEEHRLWLVREAGLAATAHVDRDRPTWEGWEDSAVPPDKVGAYLRALRKLFDEFGYHADLYGHFGQGCIHCRIDFDLVTAAGIRHYRSFMERAADLVVGFGGSLSGEHGDGQSRAELLPKMFGPELMQAFREFKAIWDPEGRMNPGKVVDAYRMDENLRLGTTYNPASPQTHFQFPDEGGSFRKATLRCVGVGTCRRMSGGTMCPSFQVTREEMHSTRGRARLLFEMLEGDPLQGGWQNEHVKEALDLCLACKGCKGDCPVSVDMASYKAEFLSHYYEGHARPASAYAFGLIHYWARLGALMPGLVNMVTQSPGLGRIAKLASGMAAERRIPPFARTTFKEWFAHRTPPAAAPAGASTVILWPDTFNDHFHPETAIAAVRVFERAGYRVEVPGQALCCGRPLFDYGMLDTARSWLADIMRTLAPQIEAGVPVVGLEPSCVAVFRDELHQFFPHEVNAQRLAGQTFLLSEFLEQAGYRYPTLHRRAIVHGHCHHKAIMKLDAEERALRGLGLDVEVLDSGCCGMAGAFGFERDHYDVSMKVGERVLLPAVRRAPADALIVADGFSCRTQIAQATERRALHLAEVIEMAAEEGPDGPTGDFPERGYVVDHGASTPTLAVPAAAAAAFAGAALIAFLVARASRPRSS